MIKGRFSFASNDDAGNDTGQTSHVRFEVEGVELDLYTNVGPIICRYERVGQRIKLHNRYFRAFNYTAWVGNMAWNGVAVYSDTANQIADYLRDLDFECESGTASMVEHYDDGLDIDFEAAIHHQ